MTTTTTVAAPSASRAAHSAVGSGARRLAVVLALLAVLALAGGLATAALDQGGHPGSVAGIGWPGDDRQVHQPVAIGWPGDDANPRHAS